MEDSIDYSLEMRELSQLPQKRMMEELHQILNGSTDASELDKDELLDRLKPFAQGCFDGVSGWPQLKPLLRDIYTYLDKSP